MSTARCERTELLVDQCAHCRGNNQTAQEQADAERSEVRARLLARPIGSTATWFPAQYPGVCYRCGNEFERGVAIRRDRVALGFAYVAECCADPP